MAQEENFKRKFIQLKVLAALRHFEDGEYVVFTRLLPQVVS